MRSQIGAGALDPPNHSRKKSTMIRKLLTVAGVAAALALAPTAAYAGGSDAPTPYTVTAEGVTLPEGVTFPAHGHINWKTSWAQHGVHFDPNNGQPGGKYIGASFIPFNLEPGECVTWVQISMYNEHFGEGGQEPICKPPVVVTPPTEEPTEPPTEEPTEPPTEEPTEPPTEEPTEPPVVTPPTEEPTEPPVVTPPTEEPPVVTPPVLHCEPPFVPGWLDENGNPSGCVNNGPGEVTEPPVVEPPVVAPPVTEPPVVETTPVPVVEVETAPVPQAQENGPSAAEHQLAETGASATVGYSALAVAMLAAGALVLVLRRRRG